MREPNEDRVWPSVVAVLGYANDVHGELHEVSRRRCEQAVAIAKPAGSGIVLTGGFGCHFNSAPLPHCYYTRRYLLSIGWEPKNIMMGVESRNTIEDAALLKPLLARWQTVDLTVVTSDFHRARATYVFSEVLPELRFRVVGVRSPEGIAAQHADHEALRLKEVSQKGLGAEPYSSVRT
jgi:uncharacterized SAM-binding protein YcdF (DUF218 family)